MNLGSFIKKAISDYPWGIGRARSGVEQPGRTSVRAAESTLRSLPPSTAYELCVAANTAVNAIAGNLSKAKRRLFTKDGQEVFSGPAYEWMNKPNPWTDGTRFFRDLWTWYNLHGEMAGWNQVVNGRIETAVLCPAKLTYARARIAYRNRGEVGMWKYYWDDGQSSEVPDSQLMFAAMFNPNDNIRGLSPLVTGSVEVGTLHWSGRYNQSFFQNGAIPSHLISLPEGTSKAEREAFTNRYLAEYNNYSHNAHKVMVVSGGDIKVTNLEQPFQDGAFMELRRQMLQQIAMLYRVPAIEMGLYDKARFDTASEERKLFMESTLMPQADMMSAVVQNQVIDRYFLTDPGSDRRRTRMSKAIANRFEEVRGESRGGLVFLVDTDTLPIANTIRVAQAEHAQRFRQAFGASLKEAAEFFGVELEDRPERDDVYLLGTERNITHPEKNPEVMSATMKVDADASAAVGGGPDKDEASNSEIKREIHRLRTACVKAARDGRVIGLAGYKTACPEWVALVRLELKSAMQDGDVEAVKSYFDGVTPDFVRNHT